jgi:hypothetical protein
MQPPVGSSQDQRKEGSNEPNLTRWRGKKGFKNESPSYWQVYERGENQLVVRAVVVLKGVAERWRQSSVLQREKERERCSITYPDLWSGCRSDDATRCEWCGVVVLLRCRCCCCPSLQKSERVCGRRDWRRWSVEWRCGRVRRASLYKVGASTLLCSDSTSVHP